jgi:hypothetical protein
LTPEVEVQAAKAAVRTTARLRVIAFFMVRSLLEGDISQYGFSSREFQRELYHLIVLPGNGGSQGKGRGGAGPPGAARTSSRLPGAGL